MASTLTCQLLTHDLTLTNGALNLVSLLLLLGWVAVGFVAIPVMLVHAIARAITVLPSIRLRLILHLFLKVGVDHGHRPATVLGFGLYAQLRHLDEAFAIVRIVQCEVDEEVGGDVGQSWVLSMQSLPCHHVAIGFVRCFVQYEKSQFRVGRHVLFDKLGVVNNIPAIRCGGGYILRHSDFAACQHTRVSTELLVLHDGNVCLLDSVSYIHDCFSKVLRLKVIRRC